mgnify:CR=1 FL=1
MAKYATGKYARSISDRSGLEFPYKEMVREWNGAFVHNSEFEPKMRSTTNGTDMSVLASLAARFVQIAVVRPTVERVKTHLTAISTRAVPSQTDKE